MSDEKEPVVDIRLPADSLEYTRAGLQTPEAFALHLGAHNRVVIERPPRLRSIAASHGGFASESTFPLPALLSAWLFPHAGNMPGTFTRPIPRGAVLQVFAHADGTGDAAYNKWLTDQRARMTTALLTADVDTVQALADEGGWEIEHYQVLLRILECDPGPIDGILEELTAAAVRSFQERYVQGEFHRRALGLMPRTLDLEPTGELDGATKIAIVEAFTVAMSPRVPASSMHPTHASVGCANFNPISPDDATANRRVSLMVYSQLPRFHDRAPCREGDDSACALFGDEEQQCLWYRLHVQDTRVEDIVQHHFRPNWLLLSNGHYLLSTLTTVPDSEEVEFQVYTATRPVDGTAAPGAEVILGPLGEPIRNKPKHGVAQVVWVPPPEFAPGEDGRTEVDGMRVVPVFRASHNGSGALAYDSYPGDDVAILFDRSIADTGFSANEATQIVLENADTGYRQTLPSSQAVPFDDRYYILRFEGVKAEGSFSLFVEFGPDHRVPVFEDVAYSELQSLDALDVPQVSAEPAAGGEHAALGSGSKPDADAEDIILPTLELGQPRESHWIF